MASQCGRAEQQLRIELSLTDIEVEFLTGALEVCALHQAIVSNRQRDGLLQRQFECTLLLIGLVFRIKDACSVSGIAGEQE